MARVIIVGNICHDLILGGIPDFPQWGTETIIPGYAYRSGGVVCNTGLAIAALDVKVSVISTISTDRAGTEILEEIERSGIDYSQLIRLDHADTALSVALTHSGTYERAFVTSLGSQQFLHPDAIETAFERLQVASSDYVLVGGYFLLPGIRNRLLPPILQALPCPVLLDTGWPFQGWDAEIQAEMAELLRSIDIFLPNEKELSSLAAEAISSLASKRRSSGAVIEKRGACGSTVHTRGTKKHVPALTVDITDTVGAGDYFNAGFIFGMTQGYSMEKCAAFGNATAALNASRSVGRSALASRAEVEHAVKGLLT